MSRYSTAQNSTLYAIYHAVTDFDWLRCDACDGADPDILIRTSGECRLSNFLLWQLAYSELFFVRKYWPQLTQADLASILRQYAQRHRRYGV